MAEAITNLNWSPVWNQAVYGATPSFVSRINMAAVPIAAVAVGRRGFEYSRDNFPELAVGMIAGAVFRYTATAALQNLGMDGLPEVLLKGALVGIAMGVTREYIFHRGQPHPSLLSVAGRSAIFGLIGAGIGAWVSDRIHDFARPDLHRNDNPVGKFVGFVNNNTPIRLPEVDLPKVSAEYPGDSPTDYGGGTTPIEQPQPVTDPIVPAPRVEPGPSTPGAAAPTPERFPGFAQTSNLAEKVAVFEHNPKIETAIASEVGRVLAGFSESSPLYPQIQHILEVQGHDSMQNAVKQYLMDHPEFYPENPAHVTAMSNAVKATFVQDYNKNHLDEVIKTLTQTPNVPTIPLEVHQPVEEITKFVTENQNNPEIFTDHVVVRGETAGHLIQLMNIEPTWDGSDLHGFVALAVSNPEAFKDIASGMGLSTEDFLKLLQEAQHDLLAAQKVYKAMSLIRTGTHLKLPTHLLVDEMKRRLAYGG